jgi:hypothetical protein
MVLAALQFVCGFFICNLFFSYTGVPKKQEEFITPLFIEGFNYLYTYFFLVILIEIFILKTTMYHKYTLLYQKYRAFI